MQQHRNEKKKMKSEVTSAQARPNYGGTSPSGHLNSRDTKFGPGKMFTNNSLFNYQVI